MELHIVGNKIIFYKWRIDCEIPPRPKPRERDTLWHKFHDRLGRYRIEDYGLLCDNDEELADIEAGLTELGIAYTTSDISPSAEELARAAEIDGKVGSRTQALEYISGLATPTLCTHWAKIDSFHPTEEKPMCVKRTWGGKEYLVDCYVSQAIKDEFVAGDIKVGDFVLVEFLEDRADRAVVFSKVFKTW